ncbi:hypothetical protein LF95_01835 [Thalassospira sp. TSL5-1]|nr:hypothetical protein LF95_01835 [Thalassospira sp. TSL5-1]
METQQAERVFEAQKALGLLGYFLLSSCLVEILDRKIITAYGFFVCWTTNDVGKKNYMKRNTV